MATFPYGIVNYTHQKLCFLKKIADHLPAVSALKTKVMLVNPTHL